MYKLLCALMVILFVFAAVVQLNDPDPLVWIAIYLSAALLTFLHSIKRIPSIIMLLATLCYASGIIYLSYRFPDTSLQAFKSVGMSSIIEEEVRELWGLVITTSWSLVMLIRQWLPAYAEK